LEQAHTTKPVQSRLASGQVKQQEIVVKKTAIVLIIGLCTGLAGAFAEHPGGTGIGVLFRSGYDVDAKDDNGVDAGLSLKLAGLPIYWGFFLNTHNDVFGLGVTGDYYLIDSSLFKEGGFDMGLHLGLGGYGSMIFYDTDTYFAAGGRVPVGLSFLFARRFEVSLGLAYNLGLRVLPTVDFPAHFFNGELGFRLWL
jgi:F0F1-type ATP synthase membrane subunit c/vacuolar-type H+-ATPase subunit K